MSIYRNFFRITGNQHSLRLPKIFANIVIQTVYPFSSQVRCSIFFYSTIFLKKVVFSEKNCEKLFSEHSYLTIFYGKEACSPKINVTFFITNWVLNILLFSSFFFQKRLHFPGKRFPGVKSSLKGRKRLSTKMNITMCGGEGVMGF